MDISGELQHDILLNVIKARLTAAGTAVPGSQITELSEMQPMKDSTLGMPSQPVSLPHPPISFLANPANCLKDPRASSLDDLLSPTTTPLPQLVSFLRGPVAGSDFGEVHLDDDGRFSTISPDAAVTQQHCWDQVSRQ
jgi:hypothetical protein